MPYKDAQKRKEHHKKYMREVWYPQNKKKHITYVSNLKKKIYLYISGYKKNGQCLDCGFRGDKCPDVLEFDHARGNKIFSVSMFNHHTTSFNKVKQEIEKCDLVCANCHRIRTFSRRIEKSV